jgi:hypothetical protein
VKQNNPFSTGFTRRQTVLAMLAAVGLSACGGGGDGGGGSPIAGVGVGGTGSFTVGRVSGFGSIIVNQVRFDDSKAELRDMDGNLVTPDRLKLGMVVAVTGSPITAASAGNLATATANSVRFGSELEGPISSAVTNSLVVLGQTVRVDATTILDLGLRSGGLSALRAGDVVEVYGFVNPESNEMIATRIELEDDADDYKIQGLVASLDTAGKQFQIGTLRISYVGTPNLPANLANGQMVRVKLARTPNGALWSAVRLQTEERSVDDVNEAEIEGLVTAFINATTFSVNGIPVNASAARFDGGPVALNRRVEVEGRIENGVLIAREVEIDTDDRDIDQEDDEFELTGSISGLNTGNKTFVVRGVTVDYNGNVRFDDGTAAMLVNGRVVEVSGTYDAVNNRIAATEIDFSTN